MSASDYTGAGAVERPLTLDCGPAARVSTMEAGRTVKAAPPHGPSRVIAPKT